MYSYIHILVWDVFRFISIDDRIEKVLRKSKMKSVMSLTLPKIHQPGENV